jgi:hypothetical protein
MAETRNVLPLAAAGLLCACAGPAQRSHDVEAARQPLTASERLIALRTFDQRHYLTAEADGGGTISADRTEPKEWERWILSDLDGGELRSGDAVQLRHVRADGTTFWMVADRNGGGPGSVLRANRTVPLQWETFVLEKPGGGAIQSGDDVRLRAASAAYYVCAERGGGLRGDGAVVVDRVQAQTWETFTLDEITPDELCPFSASLCLFERPNFGGQRFNVQALDHEAGACVDLVEHGWGARARSAINTHSKTASLLPNPDCTGHPIGVAAQGLEPTLPLLPGAAFVF